MLFRSNTSALFIDLACRLNGTNVRLAVPFTFETDQYNIEDVPKHVGPNLVFADDDQQRSRPRPDAFASRLFDPSGCDRQTDRRIKGVLGLLYSARRLNSTKSSENFFFHCRRKPIFSEFFYLYTCMET